MLRTPPVAVSQVKREILRMAGIAMENVDRALYMAVELDFSGKEPFARDERQLNYINRELVNYVVVLSGKSKSAYTVILFIGPAILHPEAGGQGRHRQQAG